MLGKLRRRGDLRRLVLGVGKRRERYTLIFRSHKLYSPIEVTWPTDISTVCPLFLVKV